MVLFTPIELAPRRVDGQVKGGREGDTTQRWRRVQGNGGDILPIQVGTAHPSGDARVALQPVEMTALLVGRQPRDPGQIFQQRFPLKTAIEVGAADGREAAGILRGRPVEEVAPLGGLGAAAIAVTGGGAGVVHRFAAHREAVDGTGHGHFAQAGGVVAKALPESRSVIGINRGGKGADASVAIHREIKIFQGEVVGGLRRGAAAAKAGIEADARGCRVDDPAPLSPEITAVVVAVAYHILAAQLDLVDAFQSSGQGIAPRTLGGAGVAQGHRLPAAVEGGDGVGAEAGIVDLHLVQSPVEPFFTTRRNAVPQVDRALRRHGGGTHQAGGRP